MEKPAQDRKRKASTSLRALAEELHVANRGRNNDLTKPQFASLLVEVEGHCNTPDQRQRAQEAKARKSIRTWMWKACVMAYQRG